ncbi:hypothetical protein [Litchfieldia alkalitelluris]|nr:hypothetical protein [Litchfieldia alkalitelluris]
MSKQEKSKQIKIRSVSFVTDEDSNEQWFELWINLAKKELMNELSKEDL